MNTTEKIQTKITLKFLPHAYIFLEESPIQVAMFSTSWPCLSTATHRA
jgi:hypothetical protein